MSNMENGSNTPSRAAKTVEAEIGEAAQVTRSVAGAVKDAVSERTEALAGKARETYASAVKSVKAAAEDPSKIADALRDVVRDHPLASIATVAVASLLIGRMIRRF